MVVMERKLVVVVCGVRERRIGMRFMQTQNRARGGRGGREVGIGDVFEGAIHSDGARGEGVKKKGHLRRRRLRRCCCSRIEVGDGGDNGECAMATP